MSTDIIPRVIGSPRPGLRFGKGAFGPVTRSTGTSVEFSSLEIELCLYEPDIKDIGCVAVGLFGTVGPLSLYSSSATVVRESMVLCQPFSFPGIPAVQPRSELFNGGKVDVEATGEVSPVES